MSDVPSEPVARAFALWRSMMADAGPEATIEEFRQGYDSMFEQFDVDPAATVEEQVLDGVRCLRVGISGIAPERTIVYFHGGGYMCGNPEGVASTAARLARAARATVIVPDYRLAPEHAHPAAHDDGVAVIRSQLQAGVPSSRLALVGDSAGGGLALSTILGLKKFGDPLPAAIALWSPWVDMEVSGATMKTNADVDPIASVESLTMSAQAYLQGQDVKTPTAHILAADLRGFPPLSIFVGSAEVLLDDSLRLAEHAKSADVEATVSVAEGLPHVYPYFASFLPEAQQTIEDSADFIASHTADPAAIGEGAGRS